MRRSGMEIGGRCGKAVGSGKSNVMMQLATEQICAAAPRRPHVLQLTK
jgi:hypothetical protein